MADRISAATFGKQIGTLFGVGAVGPMSDCALLDQFARGGEASEAAFATLVERHGTMVLRVCRHLLADVKPRRSLSATRGGPSKACDAILYFQIHKMVP